jgi:hypothetical protein
MLSQQGFADDSTNAWSYKAHDGEDQMDENDGDVVHPGIESKSRNAPNSGPICNSPRTGPCKVQLRSAVQLRSKSPTCKSCVFIEHVW